MKKTLLSIAAVAAVTLSGMANDYKFVLDGDNDLGGLTRALSTALTDVNLVQSFTLTENGITLSVKNTAEEVKTGTGLALINAGGTNAGLCAYSGTFGDKVVPEVSITVPNGKITSMKALLSGTAISFSTDITLNGTSVNMDNKEGSLFVLEWSDAAGLETVTFSWNNPGFYKQYIHSIEVTYTADLGDKKECGLSFAGKQYEAAMGDDFVAPELSNPNNLPVSWSSSDDKVATVDDNGKVTLVGKGSVVITASTEGNDDFAAGSAKYDITVIPTASNLAQLIEMAPALNDRVKVNFRSTVNYAHLSQAYVTDEEGNAACIDDAIVKSSSTTAKTAFSIGQIIEAGWIATNSNNYEPIWEGNMKVVADTVADVKYQTVDSITPADANRVVILPQMTFETNTPAPHQKVFATTANGKIYEFQDTYELAQEPAGVYNVTGVVKYAVMSNREYFWMAPIAYEPCAVVSPEIPESFDVTLSCEGLEVEQGLMPSYFGSTYAIIIEGECPDKQLSVTVAVPEGWDGFIAANDQAIDPEVASVETRASSDDYMWFDMEDFEAEGYKIGNKLTFNVDGEEHGGNMYLYKGNQVVYYPIKIYMNATPAGTSKRPTEFPALDEFQVTVSCEGLEVTVEQGFYTNIRVLGECDEEEITVSVAIPEGWDGYYSDYSYKYKQQEVDLTNTRANEINWQPVSELIEDDYKVENTFTFKTDGLQHYVDMLLFYGDSYDKGNRIDFRVKVSQKGSAVESIDAIDGNATYYNANGAKVANPAKGMYIKVVDGKATKVVVK